MMAAQRLTNAMLNKHEQPSVISAIMKQQMTGRMRTVVNYGMDILGGAGICNGPSNFLANAYTSIPIAITVEGANTLTRSLIQFGQGLTRSHPHLIDIIKSIEAGNDMKGFNASLAATISHAMVNLGRSLGKTVTRSRVKGSDPVAYYESQLSKIAANFATYYSLQDNKNLLSAANQKYYTDANVEVKKKWSKKLETTLALQKIFYNTSVIATAGHASVDANIIAVGALYKYATKKSVRVKLEHLWATEDQGNWASAITEFSFASPYTFYVSDLYNYGFTPQQTPQTHSLLFEKDSFSQFNPNPDSKKVGAEMFFNSTRVQVRDMTKQTC
jgi:hypothetical protein